MSGQRIKVIGGPWPERIGLTGRIVVGELNPRIYPRHGLGKGETIILIDDDPFLRDDGYAGWTCTIGVDDVEPLP